jgi:DNA-binding winged helix-turn-helix (wHTH) protein/Flp pilus assembly protein TadD
MKDHETMPNGAAGTPPVLQFAGFVLDTGNRQLTGPDGRALPITARAFDTLQCLALHPHQLLSKRQLLEAVWPGSIVEENNLNQQISVLRKLLGEGRDGQRFIVTVTGQGFRFVQDVTRAARAPQAMPVRASRSHVPWRVALTAVAALLAGTAAVWFTRGVTPPPAAGSSRVPAANDAYLAARAITRNAESTRAGDAVALLERAVRLDPDFAPAWAALAEAYTFAADFPPARALQLTPVQLQQHISAAVLRAFELAPNAAQTLRSAGMVSMLNRDWAEAGQRLHRAVELAGPDDYDANLQYAWFLMNVGRITEAIPYEERAMRAEPRLMRPVALRAALYEMSGELDDAEALLRASSRLQDTEPLRKQGLIMVRMARHDQCGAPRAQAEDGLPCPLLPDPRRTIAEARAYFDAVRGTESYGQLFPLAEFAAFAGDSALALTMLDRWASRPTLNLHVLWRPALASVRQQPGFEELVRKTGLADYWRASGKWGEFCRPVGPADITCKPAALAAREVTPR